VSTFLDLNLICFSLLWCTYFRYCAELKMALKTVELSTPSLMR